METHRGLDRNIAMADPIGSVLSQVTCPNQAPGSECWVCCLEAVGGSELHLALHRQPGRLGRLHHLLVLQVILSLHPHRCDINCMSIQNRTYQMLSCTASMAVSVWGLRAAPLSTTTHLGIFSFRQIWSSEYAHVPVLEDMTLWLSQVFNALRLWCQHWSVLLWCGRACLPLHRY